MPIDGQLRKVLIHPDRDGYVYVIDRITGQLLSANCCGPVNSTQGVDLKTGRPILNPAKETKLGQTVRDICPTASGTQGLGAIGLLSAHPARLHPARQFVHRLGKPSNQLHLRCTLCRRHVVMKAGPGGNRGVLTAWDPVAGKPVWEDKEGLPVWSGALVTAATCLYGTMEGWFKAVDASTGSFSGNSKPVRDHRSTRRLSRPRRSRIHRDIVGSWGLGRRQCRRRS